MTDEITDRLVQTHEELKVAISMRDFDDLCNVCLSLIDVIEAMHNRIVMLESGCANQGLKTLN